MAAATLLTPLSVARRLNIAAAFLVSETSTLTHTLWTKTICSFARRCEGFHIADSSAGASIPLPSVLELTNSFLAGLSLSYLLKFRMLEFS